MTIIIIAWAEECTMITFLLSYTFSLSLELLSWFSMDLFSLYLVICLPYSLTSLSPVSFKVNLSDTYWALPVPFLLIFSPWKCLPWILDLLALVWASCSGDLWSWDSPCLFVFYIGFPIFFKCIFSFLVLLKKESLRKKGRRGNYFDILPLLKYLYSALTLEW